MFLTAVLFTYQQPQLFQVNCGKGNKWCTSCLPYIRIKLTTHSEMFLSFCHYPLTPQPKLQS